MEPNIVIVSFDCLRPDRLGFAGYRGVETPTFDRLAEESLVFEHAYCQGPNTWISHASMFTGCLPAVHGVRSPLRKISSRVSTMAEVLKGAGYSTFALPALSLLGPEAGFARGFDEYPLDDLEVSTSWLYEHAYHRSPEATVACFRKMLARAVEPFFIWVHYFGIHEFFHAEPDLPMEYRQRFSEYAQHYDGKVSYADRAMLRLVVDALASGGMLEQTLLVLWSDHGENLASLEHQTDRHGHGFGLEEEVMRTLLMLRLPGGQQRGRRSELATSMDILPTVCDVAGLQPCEPVNGQSLLRPHPADREPVAYMENLCELFLGIRTDEWKLVVQPAADEQAPADNGRRPTWGHKLKWRLDLLTDTFRTVLSRTSRPRSHGRRRLWRAAGESEQVAYELLQNGRRLLWRVDGDELQQVDPEQAEAGAVRELEELLRRLSLPEGEGGFETLSGQERRDVEDNLSALGYM